MDGVVMVAFGIAFSIFMAGYAFGWVMRGK
jgi:hypothetical protein